MESLSDAAPGSITNVCRDGNVSMTVIETVAEAKGVDTLDLEPLYDVVDPDALDAFVRPSGASTPATTEVSFSMDGCDVVVQGDGEVVVTPPEEKTKNPAVVAPNLD